jgi:quinoprotein glucose dehydrogenase
MTPLRFAPLPLLLLASCAVTAVPPAIPRAAPAPASGDWPAYGRTALGDRRSPLTQIDRGNVAALAVAWRYHTGEVGPQYESRRPPRLSATPIAIGGTLYLLTPFGRVVALDGATGRELWRFEARVSGRAGYGDFVSRGVSYWSDSRAAAGAPCATRIFAGIVDARLIALDAQGGRRCSGFGDDGTVDLRQGLRNPPDNQAEYELTSPPAIVGDTIVVGSAVADNNRLDAASGEVRGYDARSGQLLWTWDPVPQDPADPGFATWQGPAAHRTGGANSWSVIAADPERDLVFLPTSSPSVDYWGGARLGNNLYANSVVALRASTGERVWSFQTVHHDLWDYDNAAPPALVDVTIEGRRVPAVIQATKSGQLFVLHRETGEPLFPVEERPVPASDAAGETAAPTQPFSSLPALSPMSLTAADIEALPEGLRGPCRAQFERLRHDGPFTPPSERGSLVLPSNVGGAHWGGVAYDPVTETVVVPVNRIASVVTLIPRGEIEAERARGGGGERLGLEYARMAGSPYVLRREFFAAGGRLCSPQPYGSLVAVSLRTRRILWEVPLGTAEGTPLAAGGPARGMINLGGPITTESGLLFIGAAPDGYLRAFDLAEGRELWRGRLPAGARATPMTYAAGGRQFVAVAAGGDGEIFGRSDEIVAFALPEARR